MRRLFRAACVAFGVLLALAVVLSFVMPTHAGRLPDGMRTPILAFELARSPAEIEAIFGAVGSVERASLVRAMDLGNAIDFGFMLAYGASLVLFGLGARRGGSRVAVVTSVLGAIAPLFDAWENVQLFAITAALGGDTSAPLGRLAIATAAKWACIAIALAAAAPFVARGPAWRKALGVVVIIPALATPAAFLLRGAAVEAMGASVSLGFVALFAVAVAEARGTRQGVEPV